MSEPPSDTETTAGAARDDAAEPGADRPDQRPPRGNPDRDTVDVERGEEQLDRVLGW